MKRREEKRKNKGGGIRRTFSKRRGIGGGKVPAEDMTKGSGSPKEERNALGGGRG